VLDLTGQHDDAKVVRAYLASEYERQAQAMEQPGRNEEAAGIRSYAGSLAAKG
jgi:hypothetical protein